MIDTVKAEKYLNDMLRELYWSAFNAGADWMLKGQDKPIETTVSVAERKADISRIAIRIVRWFVKYGAQ